MCVRFDVNVDASAAVKASSAAGDPTGDDLSCSLDHRSLLGMLKQTFQQHSDASRDSPFKVRACRQQQATLCCTTSSQPGARQHLIRSSFQSLPALMNPDFHSQLHPSLWRTSQRCTCGQCCTVLPARESVQVCKASNAVSSLGGCSYMMPFLFPFVR